MGVGVTIDVLVILLLILLNGLLALAEIAIVSARKPRLQSRMEAGDKGAEAALELTEDPADFLSAVQIGITLVGVLAGAFGGATLADNIAAALEQIPWLAPYSQALAVGLVVLTITYLSLILGELAPKRLALNNPEEAAVAVAIPMRTLARLTAPLVRFLSFSSTLVLRLLGIKPSSEPPVTEEEIRVMVEQGTAAGIFAEAESEMVAAVFRFGDRRVDTLMTPRTDIVWIDLEDDPGEIESKLTGSAHSRLPVGRGSLDNVLGIVEAKTLLARCLAGEPLDLEAVICEPLYVPESIPALKVLERFRIARQHVALVLDEFGGFQGLVTSFDLLESIVGEMPEPGELEGPEIFQRPDGSWLLDGMLPVDEFKELMRKSDLPGDEHGAFQTLGGFVMTYLGRIPKTGDRFEWEDLAFEIVDMDGMRVDRVIVSFLPAEEAK